MCQARFGILLKLVTHKGPRYTNEQLGLMDLRSRLMDGAKPRRQVNYFIMTHLTTQSQKNVSQIITMQIRVSEVELKILCNQSNEHSVSLARSLVRFVDRKRSSPKVQSDPRPKKRYFLQIGIKP